MYLKKILIIRFSSIGDIVLTSPLIRSLHSKYPDAEIDFVVCEEFSELIKYNPHLNSVIEFNSNKGYVGLKELKFRIDNKLYDVVLDLQNNFRSIYIRKSIKKKVVINKRIIARFLLTFLKINIYQNYTSIVERYLETVKEIGCELDDKGLEIFIPESVNASVENIFHKLNIKKTDLIVGIAPSAKHNTKKWLLERYQKLIEQLIENYQAKIILFGGKNEMPEIESIEKNINTKFNSESVVNFTGKLSLLENAAVINYCNVIVVNDTGLMHLAAAVKRKVVAIFGPTVKEFGFFPYGTESIVVENNNLRCRPCSYHGSSVCPKKHFKCMSEISTEKVFNAVKHILNLN